MEPWFWALHRLGQKELESPVLLSKRLTCTSGFSTIETAVLAGDRNFHVWASLSLTCYLAPYSLIQLRSPHPLLKRASRLGVWSSCLIQVVSCPTSLSKAGRERSEPHGGSSVWLPPNDPFRVKREWFSSASLSSCLDFCLLTLSFPFY